MKFTFFSVRKLAPALLLAAAATAAHASTLLVTYTDAASNTASLVMTGTVNGGGWFDVTNVTGIWNATSVAGPSSAFFLGPMSNRFYTNPGVLPPFTIDSGVAFLSTSGQTIQLYTYNFGSTGYASSVYDSGGGVTFSGAVTSISFTSTPEPASMALMVAGLGGLAVARRRVRA